MIPYTPEKCNINESRTNIDMDSDYSKLFEDSSEEEVIL